MGFVPVIFKDIGKKSKDLLSKKYDFKHEVKTVNKAQDGVTLEAGASHTGSLDTYVKGSYQDSSFGECETKIHTASAAKDTMAKLTLNKFYDGASVSITGTSEPAVSVEANYKQDMFNTQLIVNDNFGATVSASAGMDGHSAGVCSNVSLADGFQLKSLDFGVQATFGNTIAAFSTAKNKAEMKLSVFHPWRKDLVLGAAVVHTSKVPYAITFGTEYSLDKNLSVKARASSSGSVAFAVEHKLDIMTVGVSAEFEGVGVPAKKFGMALSF